MTISSPFQRMARDDTETGFDTFHWFFNNEILFPAV